MRVHQLIRVSGGRPTATSGHRTAHRKRWDDLERIMRTVSSAIPIITFRYYPYKRKKLTFWVSLISRVRHVYNLKLLNVQFSGGFEVECLSEYADRILDRLSGTHFNLPLAGLTVACHEVRSNLSDLVE